MKIEKLNENQIRCTLTAEDLASMKLKLSELAYGSKRAQELFRRMMQEARAQCGFDAENVPLMIEAIPMKADSLVLIVTKIEDPEELDLRFSRFTPSEFDPPAKNDSAVTRADDILNDFFRKIADAGMKLAEEKRSAKETPVAKEAAPAEEGAPADTDLVRLFSFPDLDTVIAAAAALGGAYRGENTLYHTGKKGEWQLLVHKSGHSPEDFNRVCNILSEYGSVSSGTPARSAHLKEHGSAVISEEALQRLAELKQRPQE